MRVPTQLRSSLSVYLAEISGFARLLFRLQSNRPCRDDVFDDHPLVLHHNPIHYQLYHLVLHLERRFR
jgi:hypothetical protein